MAELAGHTEIFRIRELGAGKDLGEDLKGATLMGHDSGLPGVATKGRHFDREGTDIDAHKGHAAAQALAFSSAVRSRSRRISSWKDESAIMLVNWLR